MEQCNGNQGKTLDTYPIVALLIEGVAHLDCYMIGERICGGNGAVEEYFLSEFRSM